MYSVKYFTVLLFSLDFVSYGIFQVVLSLILYILFVSLDSQNINHVSNNMFIRIIFIVVIDIHSFLEVLRNNVDTAYLFVFFAHNTQYARLFYYFVYNSNSLCACVCIFTTKGLCLECLQIVLREASSVETTRWALYRKTLHKLLFNEASPLRRLIN